MPPLSFCIFFAIICTCVHHFNGSCKAPNSPLMGLKSLFIYLEDSVPEMDPIPNAKVFSSSLHLCDFATFFLHSHPPLQRRALSIRLHFQNLTCRTSLYIQSRYFPVIIFSRTGPQGDCWIFSPTSTYTLFSVILEGFSAADKDSDWTHLLTTSKIINWKIHRSNSFGTRFR